ncbi:Uncharacterised protein [Mycobacteroides abscessus subsp. abscessus]|nr:Uncharacterised protein [Mycobacteroides abscessus subsp. abscessus]
MPSHGCSTGSDPMVADSVVGRPARRPAALTCTCSPFIMRMPGPSKGAGVAGLPPRTVSPPGRRTVCTPPPRRTNSAETA